MKDRIEKKRRFQPPTGTKSPQDWNAVMHDEGGMLGRYTDVVFKGVEELEAKDWGDAAKEVYGKRHEIRTVGPDSISSLQNVAQFPELACFPAVRGYRMDFPLAFTKTIQSTSRRRDIGELMVMGGALLSELLLTLHTKKVRAGEITIAGNPSATLSSSSLDLRSHLKVTIDNVQTIMDAVMMLVPFCNDEREFMQVFPRLLETCPNSTIDIDGISYEVNPRGYSYLELIGLSPFTFLAATRLYQPRTYSNVPIMDIHGKNFFNPLFIYALTRAKVPDQVSKRLVRHGGCPVLYPEYRHLHLIQRLGKMYHRALLEIEKQEEPEVSILSKLRKLYRGSR